MEECEPDSLDVAKVSKNWCFGWGRRCKKGSVCPGPKKWSSFGTFEKGKL